MRALRNAVAAGLTACALAVIAAPAAAMPGVTGRVADAVEGIARAALPAPAPDAARPGAVEDQANPDLQLPPPDPVQDPPATPAPPAPAPPTPAPSAPAPSNPGPSSPEPSSPSAPEVEEEPAGPTPEELQEQRERAAAAAERAARIREREERKRSLAVARLADTAGAQTAEVATVVAAAADDRTALAKTDLQNLEQTREGRDLIDPRIVALGAAAVLLIGIGGVTSGRRRTGGGMGLPWRGMSLPSFGDGLRAGRGGGRLPLPMAVERFVAERLGEIVVAIAAIVIITLALYLIANPGFLFS